MLPFDQDDLFIQAINSETGHVVTHRRFNTFTQDNILPKLNAQGYDIYFCPATIKEGRKRRKVDVLSSRWLWADMDRGDGLLPEGVLPPSVTIQTSPNKRHYYWRLRRSITDIEVIEDLLERVIDKTGADPACKDASRLMRLPGYTNCKNGFDVKVVDHSVREYSLEEIREAFPEVARTITDSSGSDKDGKPGFDLSTAMRDILTGEILHQSRASLSMHWANLGIPQKDCLDTIECLLDLGYELKNIETKRYQERKGNNKQVVESAYKKIHSEVPEYDFRGGSGSLYTKLPPLPEGGLSVLVTDIMSNMVHPIYEVAVPLAMHLVGVFGSGPYHLDGVTGTKRRAICMKSGTGKDVVTNYISACTRELADARAGMFTGINSFTPRTVHAELREFRCKSYIVSEAGVAGMSDTGDVANMRAYMLQALAAKADRPLNIKATVADFKSIKDDKLMSEVYGSVINIIAESTIETYAQMMNSEHTDVTGMMGREELLFPEPNFDWKIGNRKGFQRVGQEAMDILQPLAQRFLDNPQTGGGVNAPDKMFENVNTVMVDKLLDEDYQRCCDLRQKHIESPPAIETQYSRLHEKVKCTALILAVADAPTTDPVVTPEHIAWSVAYHDALIETVTAHLSGGGALSDAMSTCIDQLEKKILNWPANATDEKFILNKPKRIISKGWFSKIFDISNNKKFKALSKELRRSSNEAREAILKEAADRGLIERTKYDNKQAFILAKRG